MVVSKSEYMLAWGVVCLVVGTALLQFVIIGLLGILIFLVAMGILLGAGISARDIRVRNSSAFFGLILFVAALVVLAWAAAKSSWLAYLVAFHAGHPDQPLPTVKDLLLTMILSIVAALTMALALSLRSACPLPRCKWWGFAVLSVCPVAFALFLLLSFVLPIGT